MNKLFCNLQKCAATDQNIQKDKKKKVFGDDHIIMWNTPKVNTMFRIKIIRKSFDGQFNKKSATGYIS